MADVEQQPGVESSSSNESTVEKQLTVKSEANADRKPLSDLAPWAETLSKAVAGIVVAVYACGFLIVSIYHSQYGFVGTNPFRPRVLFMDCVFFA